MPVRERAVDEGTRKGRQLNLMIGAEVRTGRLMAGVSQDALGAAANLSGSEVCRIERGEAPWLAVVQASRLLRASAWIYGPRPILRGRRFAMPGTSGFSLTSKLVCRPPSNVFAEWPIPGDRDRRALDILLRGLPRRTGVEGETNLHDIQALERDINGKRRDAEIERMILLVRDSKRNRDILREADALRRSFPHDTRAMMAALCRGRDPGADGIVVL